MHKRYILLFSYFWVKESNIFIMVIFFPCSFNYDFCDQGISASGRQSLENGTAVGALLPLGSDLLVKDQELILLI